MPQWYSCSNCKSLHASTTPVVSPVIAKNFQSCWNGRDVDSDNHQSHVSYRNNGPDSGDCPPEFPKSIPRIFSETYYGTNDFESKRSQARNQSQPFVYVVLPEPSKNRSWSFSHSFSNGDAVGAMYHGDFYNGWDQNTLQNIVDKCHCAYADPTCCFDQKIITRQTDNCAITTQINEQGASIP